MAVNGISGGRTGFSPPTSLTNVGTLNPVVLRAQQRTVKEQLPFPTFKSPEINIDLQKFTQELKNKFKELENIPSFPRNTLVKLDVGYEFGIFILPEQIFSRLVDFNNQTLKISPPEFLLQHRVLLTRMIGEPAFERVISGIFVNISA